MRKINSVQRRLEWVQPRAWKMSYELRSDNELIATLGFRSLLGSFATAESADGCWTFKRIGFLQTRATIRACGSDAEIATFKNNTWSGGGTLTLADGREFLVTTNVWQTHLEIQTAAGEVLVLFTLAASGKTPPLSTSPQSDSKCLNCLGWHCLLGTSSS